MKTKSLLQELKLPQKITLLFALVFLVLLGQGQLREIGTILKQIPSLKQLVNFVYSGILLDLQDVLTLKLR